MFLNSTAESDSYREDAEDVSLLKEYASNDWVSSNFNVHTLLLIESYVPIGLFSCRCKYLGYNIVSILHVTLACLKLPNLKTNHF